MRSFARFLCIFGAIGCIGGCSDNSGSATDNGEAGAGGAADVERTAGGEPAEANGGAGGEQEVVDCRKWGPIIEDTTWGPLANCPDGFDVPSSVEVRGAGTVLTVEPGTKLKFGQGAQLEVMESAALSAKGSDDESIVFTGWQEQPGSWGGLVFYSSAMTNEVSHAVVEYAGSSDGASGNLVVSSRGPGRIKLNSTTLRGGAKFGLTVLDGASFTEFSNNTITENEGGAARVEMTAVQQLKGDGNAFVDNGKDNSVWIETGGYVTGEVTWPSVSPAIYRVDEAPGGSVFVKGHLTIEPGAVFEFVGHGGFYIYDGSAGLSAVGTKEQPIVFRGVDGSLWSGIGFCHSNWAGNALEFVQVHDAKGAYGWDTCGAGKLAPAVYVSQIQDSKPSQLRIKDVSFTNSDTGGVDLVQVKPSALIQEGKSTGTGAGGALKLSIFG